MPHNQHPRSSLCTLAAETNKKKTRGDRRGRQQGTTRTHSNIQTRSERKQGKETHSTHRERRRREQTRGSPTPPHTHIQCNHPLQSPAARGHVDTLGVARCWVSLRVHAGPHFLNTAPRGCFAATAAEEWWRVEESVTEWIEVDSARRAEGRLRASRQGSPSQLPTASPACGGGGSHVGLP